jgi:hypothetical protein
MVTRPDTAYIVSQINQCMHVPKTSHMEAINRILKYLKRTPRMGIFLKNNNYNEIYGYTDTDFDRKFITGYYTIVGGNIVTWKRKK